MHHVLSNRNPFMTFTFLFLLTRSCSLVCLRWFGNPSITDNLWAFPPYGVFVSFAYLKSQGDPRIPSLIKLSGHAVSGTYFPVERVGICGYAKLFGARLLNYAFLWLLECSMISFLFLCLYHSFIIISFHYNIISRNNGSCLSSHTNTTPETASETHRYLTLSCNSSCPVIF